MNYDELNTIVTILNYSYYSTHYSLTIQTDDPLLTILS